MLNDPWTLAVPITKTIRSYGDYPIKMHPGSCNLEEDNKKNILLIGDSYALS
jgi:hypothetical protein